MSRLSKDERYAAVKTVELWVSKGFSRSSVRLMIGEKFGLRSRDAQNKLISQAMAEIDKGIDKNSMKAMIVNKLDCISEKAFSDGKYSDAIRALDSQSKLLGLNENNKVEIRDEDKTYTVTFG